MNKTKPTPGPTLPSVFIEALLQNPDVKKRLNQLAPELLAASYELLEVAYAEGLQTKTQVEAAQRVADVIKKIKPGRGK